MTEARWKLVVDEHGVTIANDRFQFTANGTQPEPSDLGADDAVLAAAESVLAESSQLEGMVSELQTMTRRTYGQFCGLARALEIVGERWSMLIVRDLLVGPKSLADLHRGLPRMPADTLSARLGEFERTGIVRRQDPTETNGAAVYELTEYGFELEDIVNRFALWGARLLDEPRSEDIVTVDSMIMAMRATFRPEAARGLRARYELRLGDVIIHACVEDGKLQAGAGGLPDADLVIEPGPMLKPMLAAEISPAEALDSGMVHLIGDAELLNRFVDVFHIPNGKSRV